jgi:ornithine decarboxylase
MQLFKELSNRYSNAPASETPTVGVEPETTRLERFLERTEMAPPFLAIDPRIVRTRYLELRRALPHTVIYYAVKANPQPGVLRTLAELGSCFDVASAFEMNLCLGIGIPAHRLSFGNTVKKASAIARAHSAGVTVFACDSAAELEKIARHAPGADVVVRLFTTGRGSEWPLSRKFGCDPGLAYDLLLQAPRLGLNPSGITFHVGSQQTDPGQWDEPIARSADLFRRLRNRGIRLQTLNLGGGFPAHYISPIQPIDRYGAEIRNSLNQHFEGRLPHLIAEPGRYLVAEAGVLQTEVVLVSRKSSTDDMRWVYLDCGMFGGLVETMDEAIKYPLRTPGRSGPPMRVALAGPTCDSADILYERTAYFLPVDLREGDTVQVGSAGAYTYTYSSVGFNGFPPLRAVCV